MVDSGPSPQAAPVMTAEILVGATDDGGTRYRAIARHVDAAGREQHEEMGFLDGWSSALDQLVEFVQ